MDVENNVTMPSRGTRPYENNLRDLFLPFDIPAEDSWYRVLEQWYGEEAEPFDHGRCIADTVQEVGTVQEAQMEERSETGDQHTDSSGREGYDSSDSSSRHGSESDPDGDSDDDSGGDVLSDQPRGQDIMSEPGMVSLEGTRSEVIDLTGDESDAGGDDYMSTVGSQSQASGTSMCDPIVIDDSREVRPLRSPLAAGGQNPPGSTTTGTHIGLVLSGGPSAALPVRHSFLSPSALRASAPSSPRQDGQQPKHEPSPELSGRLGHFTREPSGASSSSVSDLFVSGHYPLERSGRTSPPESIAGSTWAPSLGLDNIPEIADQTEAAYVYRMPPPSRPLKHLGEEGSDGEESPFKRRRRGC